MSRFNKTLTLCTAALLVYGTSTYAATDSTPPATPAAHQWQHRGHGGMMHDLEKIHAQLKLTADQEQQWQAAVTAMKTAHQQQRAAFEQSRAQMKTLMQAPVLDLRAISAAHEQMGAQARQVHAQVQETWLKFYDTLDTTQKTLVSATLKSKWQAMAMRHAKMAEHWKNQSHDAAASQPQ